MVTIHQTVIWVAFRRPSYLMCSTANKLSLFYPLTPLTTICKGVVSCSLPYPVCLSAYWKKKKKKKKTFGLRTFSQCFLAPSVYSLTDSILLTPFCKMSVLISSSWHWTLQSAALVGKLNTANLCKMVISFKNKCIWKMALECRLGKQSVLFSVFK